MTYLVVIVSSYLLGSIPFGFLAGYIKGVDVRQCGSGNIGATNVLRVLGRKYGYAVFLADALKGFIAVRLALWLGRDQVMQSHLLGIVAALSVVVGHSFPIWLRLRGGKGVAASAGACVGLFPMPTLLVSGLWLIIFFTFRFVSLASIISASALPLVIYAFSSHGTLPDYSILGFSILLAVLVIWRHRSNISRLIKGTEPRFGRK